MVEPNQKLQTSELGGSIKSSEVTTPVGEGLVERPDGVRPAPWGRLQGGKPRPAHLRWPQLSTGVQPQVSGLVLNLVTGEAGETGYKASVGLRFWLSAFGLYGWFLFWWCGYLTPSTLKQGSPKLQGEPSRSGRGRGRHPNLGGNYWR